MTSRRRNLQHPDEVLEADLHRSDVVRLGDLTIARLVQQPGWRWSTHTRPRVGGDWCQTRHVGVVMSGHIRAEFADGSSMDLGPDDVYDIAPGHDSWVVGEEPYVTLAWEGVRTWATPIGVGERLLVTLVFTDLVGSTTTAAGLGERAWSDLLARHNELVRRLIGVQRGREVQSTGDGFLATFDGAMRAIRFAMEVRSASTELALHVRVGVHTGEVDIVGTDVRGIAVHEAARVMSAAEPNQILVSEITRALADGSEVRFGPGRSYDLKGIEGPRVLYPLVDLA